MPSGNGYRFHDNSEKTRCERVIEISLEYTEEELTKRVELAVDKEWIFINMSVVECLGVIRYQNRTIIPGQSYYEVSSAPIHYGGSKWDCLFGREWKPCDRTLSFAGLNIYLETAKSRLGLTLPSFIFAHLHLFVAMTPAR